MHLISALAQLTSFDKVKCSFKSDSCISPGHYDNLAINSGLAGADAAKHILPVTINRNKSLGCLPCLPLQSICQLIVAYLFPCKVSHPMHHALAISSRQVSTDHKINNGSCSPPLSMSISEADFIISYRFYL